MLPQSGITVFDKSKGEVRELRYCPNENSVWTDEQGAKALKKSVVFRDGMLFVREDQPNLKKFLDSDIIHQIPNNEKTAYYALNRELVFNGGGGKNHVHFYCFICGQTFCLDNCGIEEMRIPAGYKLDSINILIRGICEKCG